MPPKTPSKRKRSLSGLVVEDLSAAWAAGLAAHSSPTRNTNRRDTLLAALEVLNCEGIVASSPRVAERIEASGVLLHTEYTPMHLVYLVWEPLMEHVASFYTARQGERGRPRQALDVARCSEPLRPRFNELFHQDALEGKSTDEAANWLYFHLLGFLGCGVIPR